jgi:RecA/RadA recombinase
MVDSSLLDDIIANATKRMQGQQRIHGGDHAPPVYRIPFDSLELNLATYGGAPMGRMIRPWGGKSSCKSMIAWGLARQAQQHRSERFPDGLTVAYYDIEGVFDPVYVRDKMGVDIEKPKLVVVEEGLIEDISRSLDSLLYAINIHILDSASFAQSFHGFDAKKESRQPGFDAIAWKNAFRSAEQNMDKRENMVVIIDQVRTDFKTGAEKAAGGHVPDHASSMSLHHRRGKKLYRAADGTLTDTRPKTGNDELSGSHRIDGYEVEIEVDKSRVCRPFGKARLEFDIDALAFNQILQLKKAGLFLGVIQQSGSYFTIPTQQKSINGHAKMDERLAVDDSLVMQIFAAADKYMREAVYA